MSAEYSMGVGVGLAVAVIAVAIWKLTVKVRGGAVKAEYDERQQLARGKAYRNGFYALVGCNGVIALLELFGCSPFTPFTGLMTGILVSLMFFAVTAIRHDAYLSMTTNARSWLAWGWVIAVLNLVGGGTSCFEEGFLVEGKLNESVVSLMLGIAWLVILLVFYAQRRSEEAEEP